MVRKQWLHYGTRSVLAWFTSVWFVCAHPGITSGGRCFARPLLAHPASTCSQRAGRPWKGDESLLLDGHTFQHAYSPELCLRVALTCVWFRPPPVPGVCAAGALGSPLEMVELLTPSECGTAADATGCCLACVDLLQLNTSVTSFVCDLMWRCVTACHLASSLTAFIHADAQYAPA